MGIYIRIIVQLLNILVGFPGASDSKESACSMDAPAFHMMYNIRDVKIYSLDCTPFPIWNQSVVPCPVLTVNS